MAAVFYLNTKNDTNASFSTQGQTSQSPDAQYIYSILSKMNEVKIKDSIFKDPVFTSLKDNTVTFSAQTSGRSNPFAPFGNDSAAVQSSNVGSSTKSK